MFETMQGPLKIDVKYKQSVGSVERTELIQTNPESTLEEIINQACNEFHLLPGHGSEFCFLLRRADARGIDYICEENRHWLSTNVVHLVPIPSLAAQQLIEQINSVLKRGCWGEPDCHTVTGVLVEVTNLLPCQRFATEFLKMSGHEIVFSLAEQFQSDEDRRLFIPASTRLPNPKIWKYVAACLAELAEYGLNSSEDSISELYNHNSILDESLYATEETDVKKKRETLIPFISVSPEFSWFLTSERFLSVLICQCRMTTELKTLRDSVICLLKVMNDCPPKAEFVIQHTGPGFIFEQLRKIRELQEEISTAEPCPTNTSSSSVRNVFSRVGSISLTSASSVISRSPLSRADSSVSITSATNEPSVLTDQLSIELVSLLLDMIYLALFHSRRHDKLAERLPLYLSTANLRELGTFCPQIRRVSTCSERSYQPDSVDTASSHTDSTARETVVLRNGGSTGAGRSTFFVQDLSSWLAHQDSSRHSQEANDILSGLIRLQRVYLSYLADELNTPLEDELMTALEKLENLCDLASCEFDSSVTDPSQPELLYMQLGFKHPKSPLDDFEPSPGRLGYSCLHSFFRHCTPLKKLMLHYRPSTMSYVLHPTSVDPFGQCNQDSGARLNPRKSALSNGEVSETWTPAFRCRSANVSSELPFGTNLSQPVFPLVSAATELIKKLCDLLDTHYYWEPLPRWRPGSLSSSHSSFYPILFNPSNQEVTPFEELFFSAFLVLFDTWTQLNAGPGDQEIVLSLVSEQLTLALSQKPQSFDELKRILTRCTPRFVRSVRKEAEEKSRCRTMESLAMIEELKSRLTREHKLNVKEHRLNYLSYRGALEYSRQKGQGRDAVKREVVLSPDREFLIVREPREDNSHPPTVCETWPLVRIDRVSTGVEERVKKHADRTLVLHMRNHESPDPVQIHLLAPSVLDHTYWMDGLNILLKKEVLSDTFREDVQRLLELDMKVRLCGLDLSWIPNEAQRIPPDPPEFDFEENCI